MSRTCRIHYWFAAMDEKVEFGPNFNPIVVAKNKLRTGYILKVYNEGDFTFSYKLPIK